MYSFVFLSKMKLHSSVQAFLREYLLNRLRRSLPKIEVIQKRAINYLEETCSQRESRFPSLDKTIEDDEWKEASLGLIHHTFWMSSDDGWGVFLPAFVAGLLYDRNFAWACLEIIISVFDTLRAPEKQRFEIIRRGLIDSTNQDHTYSMLDRLEKLNRLQNKNKFANEIAIFISLLQGQSLFESKRYRDALAKFEETEKGLTNNSGKAKELLGDALYLLGDALQRENPLLENMWFSSQILNIFRKAIIWMPDKYKGYSSLGYALNTMLRYDEAIQAFETSIELYEANDDAYYGMGVVYRNQRRLEKSIEYCQKAANVDPDNFLAHNGLGYLYNQSGKYQLANNHLEKATEDSYNSYPFVNLGITKLLLGESKDAGMKLFQKAKELSFSEKEIGTKGWIEVIMGNVDVGMKNIVDALKRKNYMGDVQDIYDWTMLLARAPNPLPGVQILLDFISSESVFNNVKKLES
jgi:tetratricopeptide (TPR) repeat protein